MDKCLISAELHGYSVANLTSEQKQLIDHLDFGLELQLIPLVLLDADGMIASLNGAAEELYGVVACDVVGLHVRIFYPPEALIAEVLELELSIAKFTGGMENTGWRIKKDGSRFWAHLVLLAVRGAEGNLLGFEYAVRRLPASAANDGLWSKTIQRAAKAAEAVNLSAVTPG